jgi:CheY-like chemotaxis protein
MSLELSINEGVFAGVLPALQILNESYHVIYTGEPYHVNNGEAVFDSIFSAAPLANKRNSATPRKLILTDAKTPAVSGTEISQKIKLHDLTKSNSAVMLTSSKEDRGIRACYQHRTNSYIFNTVNFKGFAEAIKDVGFYWPLLNHPSLLQ